MSLGGRGPVDGQHWVATSELPRPSGPGILPEGEPDVGGMWRRSARREALCGVLRAGNGAAGHSTASVLAHASGGVSLGAGSAHVRRQAEAGACRVCTDKQAAGEKRKWITMAGTRDQAEGEGWGAFATAVPPSGFV